MANRRYPCGASFFMSEEMDATIRSLATGSYLSDVIRELLEEALKAREASTPLGQMIAAESRPALEIRHVS